MNKEYFMGIYCPPSAPKGEYPNRITKEVYYLLHRLGIRQIYGYYDDEPGVEYLLKNLDYSAEFGITFYPRLQMFEKFLGERGSDKYPLFFDMTESEREGICKEFMESIDEIKEHPGFGGIIISDERPFEAYDGMGVAARLFAENYPDKEFHYNALNYFGDDMTLFYRDGDDTGREYQLTGDLEYGAENRFSRYKVYVDGYLDKCHAKHLSTDLYPFAPVWEKVPASIHRGLYETKSIFASYKKERGVSCYVCVQVGDWDKSFRDIGRPETALHMNVAAAYHLDGFIFFPGIYPNDWIGDPTFEGCENGKTALIDAYGKPTEHYAYVSRLIEHMQVCAPTLLSANWHGVCTVGTFEGGFGDVDFSEIDWSECIYKGGMPENEPHEYKGKLPEIETTSQLFIGVFENDTADIYLITNNSIVTDTTFEIPNLGAWRLTMDGKTVEGSGTVKVARLNAGESAMLEVAK